MPLSKRFPAEWANQSAVLLAWPFQQGDFRSWMDDTEQTYCSIAKAISDKQPLIVLCQDDDHQREIESQLANFGCQMPRVRLMQVPYDDVWVRDTAPLTVETEQGPLLLNFRFNGWGGKYDHTRDADLAANIHAQGLFQNTPMETHAFVLEGGSLETDGAGTLLTTAKCLLNRNRNPEFTQNQIEEHLKERFGLSRILWLYHGHAEGDDTDAHVDTLARFCDAATIAYTACDRESDPLFGDLQAMAAELQRHTDSNGQPYNLVPLPIPMPITDEDAQRLPATYANFLIINGAVLVPTYRDPADDIALTRLANCFPDREIIPIYATPLIRQYGSIHCMTMQFPHSVPVSLTS